MNRYRQNLVGLYTIVHKELTRVLRIWVQTLVPPAITMSLYFVIFGQLIGRRVGEMGGLEFMSFIAPGLIIMAVIQNSYGNVVSSFFGAKFARHIEEMMVSPMPNSLILLGYVVGGMGRGLLVGLLVAVIASLFTPLSVSHPFIMIAVVLMTSAAFSLAGLINAVFAKKFDDISIIPTFILTPLTYLGGVFYTVELLPGVWRDVSLFNPILYMVNLFRYSIHGISDVRLDLAFAIIITLLVSLYFIALFLLKRGIGLRA
ncbi:ABC-2 type transport system permease protein [Natronospira proteinivora]|uniref:Transport permease protein n=1 Tax=Natronospira proteinivora TaxID=1807133 RepID=A0ABT1GAV3_9GAMM|nr:ABC transporter permease [Natronospira proteinivora]MCP1728035.1 ABC-2 type transport system permease protein [Natronospira proteinivora]